jgi:hypothetical protein
VSGVDGARKGANMRALEWVTGRLAREFAKQVRTGRYSYGGDVETLEHLHALLTQTAEGRMRVYEDWDPRSYIDQVADPKLKAGLSALLT